MSGDDCASWVLLWAKKLGRRTGELKKGVGDGASWAEVVTREPVERLRFMDIVAVWWT